jgi:drug/metabolite transporter (DMT)-like permease
LLYATTPIFVLLLSRLFLRERLTRKKIVGVILGFAGVAIVIVDRGVDARYGPGSGDFFIAIAVVTWALYTVFGRRLIMQYGAMTSTSMTLIVGSLMFFPIGIWTAADFPFASLTTVAWLQILYLGLITSVVTYFLWYYALARIEAGKVALFSNLQPILTTLLAVIFLGYSISGAFLIGGAIAIAGIVIAQFS